MDFQSIFEEYYTQLRGDSDIPDRTDSEWAVAVRFGNSAIRRWKNVDFEAWDELWTDTVTENETITYQAGVDTYDAPANMDIPPKTPDLYKGMFVTFSLGTASQFIVPIMASKQLSALRPDGAYVYFTGNPNTGFTLHYNGNGQNLDGYEINFAYYKKPTMFDATTNDDGTVAEDGATVTEVPDPYFIINHMLASRFRAERNYPALQIADRDAEAALNGMQLKNGRVTNIPHNDFGS